MDEHALFSMDDLNCILLLYISSIFSLEDVINIITPIKIIGFCAAQINDKKIPCLNRKRCKLSGSSLVPEVVVFHVARREAPDVVTDRAWMAGVDRHRLRHI